MPSASVWWCNNLNFSTTSQRSHTTGYVSLLSLITLPLYLEFCPQILALNKKLTYFLSRMFVHPYSISQCLCKKKVQRQVYECSASTKSTIPKGMQPYTVQILGVWKWQNRQMKKVLTDWHDFNIFPTTDHLLVSSRYNITMGLLRTE